MKFKISVFEILEPRGDDNDYVLMHGSGRLRTCLHGVKEVFKDFYYQDVPYIMQYAIQAPVRIQARNWNGSFTDCVFK